MLIGDWNWSELIPLMLLNRLGGRDVSLGRIIAGPETLIQSPKVAQHLEVKQRMVALPFGVFEDQSGKWLPSKSSEARLRFSGFESK
jgi:hypothetical protein